MPIFITVRVKTIKTTDIISFVSQFMATVLEPNWWPSKKTSHMNFSIKFVCNFTTLGINSVLTFGYFFPMQWKLMSLKQYYCQFNVSQFDIISTAHKFLCFCLSLIYFPNTYENIVNARSQRDTTPSIGYIEYFI